MPAQAVNRVRKAKVVHLHRRRAFPTVLLAGPLKKKTAQGHVRGIQWPRSEIITGTRVTAEVDGSGRLHLSLTPLPQPVFIARRRFDYEYDPQIVVRELPLPPVRPQAGKATTSALTPLENAVLQTIRKLGYLDEEGRALLPMANLLNNLREQQGTGQAHSSEAVRAATSRLLSQRRLTWATGSCGPDGLLNHPARPGERKVRLVCYTPFVLPRRKDTPGQWRVVHLPSGTSQHGVAGHLMKIEHLGKEASDAARSAYAEAHRKAGLAGSHTLPEGHTYVRPHQRGGA
ncbi:hypothetical protein ACFTXK_01005 [Streptomyces sp. NPDC056956]|uniref:hypothetical protein n=1 Tax=unclassified Streptomyces TaxID=2593676 RepID=UPI00363AB4E9